jgi:two-component system response regulator YesN
MNTILLVDDDQYVLDGLLKHVPWDDMGVEVIGTASNGAEALAKFHELLPDILITDVYMPEMDGFQLTEAIHLVNASIPIVILSGYDDYANARKAVKSGIHHFLMKPPSISEIVFVVREVVEQLNQTKERDELLASYMQQQDVLQRSMRDVFLRNLLSTRYQADELSKQRIVFMGLPEHATVQVLSLVLVHAGITNLKQERDWQLLRFGTGNIIRETLDKCLGDHHILAEVISHSDKEFDIIFLHLDSPEECVSIPDPAEVNQPFIKEVSAEIVDNVLSFMRISLLCGLGTPYSGYERIIDSFLESQAAIEIAEMNELNRIYAFGDMVIARGVDTRKASPTSNTSITSTTSTTSTTSLTSNATEQNLNIPLDSLRKLHDAIFQKHLLQTRDLWMLLKKEVPVGTIPLPVLRGVYAGVISSMWIAWFATTPQEDSEQGLEELLVTLNQCKSVGQLTEWMDDHISRLIARLTEAFQGKKSHALVDRVIKEYIEKSYHRSISLEEIAQTLHVNRNYLSQLFKRITGEPFVTYLNKYRIEKAKEHIMTGKYMVYEISEMVGFQNSTYFSQVFKSITGYSPSEFIQ